MKLFIQSTRKSVTKPASSHPISRQRFQPVDQFGKNDRFGLTLVEIMIALTMTLIVLGAMMTAFQYASQEMASGRALMELANRARGAESLLRSDLAGLTVEAKPYAQTVTPAGYLEYVEGPSRDATNYQIAAAASEPNINGYLGDVDDILGMTVRSSGGAFRGRSGNTIVESPLAEVVWFTTFIDRDGIPAVSFTESIRVHRRVLLIRPNATAPGLPTGMLLQNGNLAAVDQFFLNNDISARVVPGSSSSTFNVFANSLTDLAIRANRFCHRNANSTAVHNFPNAIVRDWLLARSNSDDIVLTDVCGFDIRAYSPNATVNKVSDMTVQPGDPSFVSGGTVAGAYVDLAHGGGGWFSDPPHVPGSQCSYPFVLGAYTGPNEHVFDTWTPYYETDGVDQDGDGLTDEGTDGLDTAPFVNGVDDTNERETMPPYPNPMRGMKISIRLIEKGTKQVHQSSIVHSFLPE